MRSWSASSYLDRDAQYGDKDPGAGLYDIARSLGYRFDKPYVFWAQQVQDVFKRHGRPQRVRRSARPASSR